MKSFIFILPNIYEITNGVSKKYIKFIEFLSSQSSTHLTVFLTKTKKSSFTFPKLHNVHFHLVKGIRVPYYKEIKVPFVSYQELSKQIKTGREVILFHGEFFWLYDMIEKIFDEWKEKKDSDLKIFINWHTDYEYYLQHSYQHLSILPSSFFNIQSFMQRLYLLLEKKVFHGIIVTGPMMIQKFSPYTSHIFNANEIDLSIYHETKFETDCLFPSVFHGFYCGRMSREKNIDLIPSYLFLLQKTLDKPIHMHMIGGGPDLNEFKKQVENDHSVQYHFYGSLSSEEIFELYMRFSSRFFLFCSTSETFGKTPFEASACGIPVFIIQSRITHDLYQHQKNAFIFQNIDQFVQSFLTYWNWDSSQKKTFLLQSYLNTQSYHQQLIFERWFQFMIEEKEKKQIYSFFQSIFFKTMTQVIQCSGDFFAEK